MQQFRISVILIAWLSLFGFSVNAVAEYHLLERVVAIVEDDVVLASEIRMRMVQMKKNIDQRKSKLPPDDVLYEQVLERQILDSLQLQRAGKMNVRISDQQLNAELEQIATRNQLSLSQFRKALEQRGDSYLAYREQLRRELIIREVQRRSVIRGIAISQNEIDNLLKSEQGQLLVLPEYYIDHMLIAVSASATDAAKQRAEQNALRLRTLATEVGEFSTAAKTLSADHKPLGWRRSKDIPSLFAGLTDTLIVGEISQPIESSSGYHLVKIVRKRGGIDKKTTETDVRHILISPNEIRSKEDTKALALSIKKKLSENEDFVALARTYSDDSGSALAGGNLGWTEPGTLVPEFQQAMDDTTIGSVSEPFESQFGWHILEVLERRERDRSLELAEQQARMAIAETKFDDELNHWLQELRDNAYIEIK